MCPCICIGQIHSYDRFIVAYKQVYHNHWHVRQCDSLIHITCVDNLYSEKGLYTHWNGMGLNNKRDSLFLIIDKPLLAFEYAINPRNGELYRYSGGPVVYYKKASKDPTSLCTFVHLDNSYDEIMKKLSCYLVNNQIDYCFSITNVNPDITKSFWTIQGNRVYALRYNENNGCFISYEADYYLQSIIEDEILDGMNNKETSLLQRNYH